MRFKDWRTTGDTFTYRQLPVFYRESGKGSVLLLIHGFPSSSHDWHKIWPDLSASYRLIAPDMLGFGYSAKPRGYNYTLGDQADLHESLLAQLSVSRCHVLCHDYGVSVAQELLARQQEGKLSFRIDSLALLNGGIFPGEHHPLLIQRLLAGPFGFILTRFLNREKLRESFHRIFGPVTKATETEVDDFWAMNTHNNGHHRTHRLIRYMHERPQNRERWVGALTQAGIPLCHINGNYDPISGHHVADVFRKTVPAARVIDLPEIGHYPQTEAPKDVTKHYLEFREGLDQNG